jgi:ribose 5-phosphate isomerase B
MRKPWCSTSSKLAMPEFSPRPRLYFASDHAGFALKQALMQYASTLGCAIDDLGAFENDPEDDYPDFVTPLAKKVADENRSLPAGRQARGVIIGGSGQGEAMAANRVSGIRAAVFYGNSAHPQTDMSGESLSIMQSVREHNDANVLSIGARFSLGRRSARGAAHVSRDAIFF